MTFSQSIFLFVIPFVGTVGFGIYIVWAYNQLAKRQTIAAQRAEVAERRRAEREAKSEEIRRQREEWEDAKRRESEAMAAAALERAAARAAKDRQPPARLRMNKEGLRIVVDNTPSQAAG